MVVYPFRARESIETKQFNINSLARLYHCVPGGIFKGRSQYFFE